MIWEESTNRFIAFFDIMGFKNYVFRNTHEATKEKLIEIHEIIDEVNTAYANGYIEDKESVVKVSIFSDSIVIISNNDSANSAFHLFLSCSWILSKCMVKGIPIKGAISYGFVTADFEKSIFFGKALIDAYQLQDELFMYGCVIDGICEEKIVELNMSIEYLFEDRIQFKGGVVRHYALNWVRPLLEIGDKQEDIQESVKRFYHLVSGSTRKYVDNTIDFANKVLDKQPQVTLLPNLFKGYYK